MAAKTLPKLSSNLAVWLNPVAKVFHQFKKPDVGTSGAFSPALNSELLSKSIPLQRRV